MADRSMRKALVDMLKQLQLHVLRDWKFETCCLEFTRGMGDGDAPLASKESIDQLQTLLLTIVWTIGFDLHDASSAAWSAVVRPGGHS